MLYRILDRIDEAELEAERTCESCGGKSDGIHSRGGLLTNFCGSC